ISAIRSDLNFVDIRGNIQTRLRKLDSGEYDAIILAAAGLTRLGLKERIRSVLPPEASLPSAGQGALGIEAAAHRTDIAAWLAPLNDANTAACVRAERAVSRALAGSCEVPLAAFAEIHGSGDNQQIRLRGLVALPDGSQVAAAELIGDASDPEALGLRLVAELRAAGADQILAALPGALNGA
ncbi:MAG: hydroxymethylbilane synthase, partial [Rhodocyclaceae bacterium]|nr:hydroxymethylbilane synthase [Rhodocyclaceae bacterium]